MHFLKQLPEASALFVTPKQASAIPARPTPNFFSAARRVTDWAMLLVSSSNLLLIILFLWFFVFSLILLKRVAVA
jgi:hypothetical protein